MNQTTPTPTLQRPYDSPSALEVTIKHESSFCDSAKPGELQNMDYNGILEEEF